MGEVTELKDGLAPKPAAPTPVTEPAPRPANPIRRLTVVVLLLALVFFVYGLFADRLTPYTDQASVRAYVVTLAPDVAGRVTAVNVIDNQSVKAGQVLYVIDHERYGLAVRSAEAQLSTAGQSVGASTASLAAAEARLVVAEATLTNVQRQVARVLPLVQAGVRPKADGDAASADLRTASADVVRARADVEQARQNLGPQGPDNPQIRQAEAAVGKARRDFRDTTVRAPSNGRVTNLQLAAGRFVAAGQTALTFIDSDATWIDADMRENSLEYVKAGDPVGVTLDVRPGRVYAGKVESIGWGVENRNVDPQTGLPTIRNDSGWVREPQRFTVRIRLDAKSRPVDVRVGSQASLVIYTRISPLTDAVGRLWIAVVAYLSYLN
jgi:multidrug resistance efflux pump